MKYTILLVTGFLSLNALAQTQFIELDSVSIKVHTTGLQERRPEQPVVVFESGLGTPLDNWGQVLSGVAELAPVVTYDRPGIGESAPVADLPTIKNVADRLVRLLQKLGAEPPYVLVGHSLGGLYVRGFALYYPEMLAGLIIIDPADFTETRENQRSYYDVLGWEEARVDSLIQALIDRRRRSRPQAPAAILKERQVLEALRERDFAEIIEHQLPNIPVHILTGGRFDMLMKYRSEEYDEEALFRSKMNHRILRWVRVIQSVEKGMFFYSADAGHFVQYDDPELVISSIKIVLTDYELLQSGG